MKPLWASMLVLRGLEACEKARTQIQNLDRVHDFLCSGDDPSHRRSQLDPGHGRCQARFPRVQDGAEGDQCLRSLPSQCARGIDSVDITTRVFGRSAGAGVSKKNGSSGNRVGDLGANYSAGSMQVRIFSRRYSSSRSPYARRWSTRILLFSPSTNPSETLFSGLQ